MSLTGLNAPGRRFQEIIPLRHPFFGAILIDSSGFRQLGWRTQGAPPHPPATPNYAWLRLIAKIDQKTTFPKVLTVLRFEEGWRATFYP